MPGVDLLTNVIINGRTTAGFTQLEKRLSELGTTVDQIGRYVRDFERDSVEVYRNYEDNMLAANYALSAQYDDVNELSKVMKDLDRYASSWAATTIFHTSDVSAAINEAAHAGWNYDQIVLGIPQAMMIAQAGSMDLTTSLGYLTRMIKTTHTDFEDMGTLIDQWAKAGNLSATNIQELGEAFMSLSSSAMFADSTQELFTLLAVLADAGVTGTQAGTQLRAAMMRVVAPTNKAKEAMAELGATEEELEAWTVPDDVAVQLQQLGFSAYDAKGDLLPMVDIFKGLHDSLQGMTEQERFDILSDIFPLRTINAANAFYDSISSGHMDQVFNAIGDSEGYAAQGMEIMMSGMTGSIEELKSKWENFEKEVGETLAPGIESLAGWLGQITDGINSLDEPGMAALVSSMTAIAGLGPVMLGANGIIRAIRVLGPSGVALVAGFAGLSAVVGYLTTLSEIEFEDHFGTVILDLDTLGQHIDGLDDKFGLQLSAISQWEEALASAEEEYERQSTRLSASMLEDVISGKTLTPEEIGNLNSYAEALVNATYDAIKAASGGDKAFLNALINGTEPGSYDEGALIDAEGLVGAYYGSLYQEAAAIGEELRQQMVAALMDRTLDDAEREAIQATQDRLSQIMAEISREEDEVAYQKSLIQASRVSWDSISEFMESNAEKLQAEEANINERFDEALATIRVAYEKGKNKGGHLEYNGQVYAATEEGLAKAEIALENQRQATLESARQRYGEPERRAFNAAMADSDTNGGWNLLKEWFGQGLMGMDEYGNIGYDYHALQNKTHAELDAAQAMLTELEPVAKRVLDQFGYLESIPEVAPYIGYLRNIAGVEGAINSELNQRYVYGAGTGVGAVEPKLEQAIAELARLEGEQARIDREIADREGRIEEKGGWKDWWYTFTSGETSDYTALHGASGTGGLYGQRDQVNLDIAEAEAQVARLQEEYDNMVGPNVVATLDTTAVDNYQPETKYMPVITKPSQTATRGTLFAEGGRATVASIFGEAGPEWAIPEEHTARTMELLNAARAASGFTWGELLERYGGLNAGAGGSVVIHYSPTINAQDAQGVEAVLTANARRLKAMVEEILAERKLRSQVEVYV